MRTGGGAYVLNKVLVLLLIVGCTKRNSAVCCENAAECAAIGTSEVVACATGACVNHECVVNGSCDGNEDCQPPAVCLTGQCAVVVPIDAAQQPAFDVAYPNVWRFSVAGPVPLNVLFVNRASIPLSMSTLQLKSIVDNHPTAFVRITAAPSQAMIAPGVAGGYATPYAEAVLIGSGIVSEPRADTNSIYADIEFVDAPEGTYDIEVDAVLALDGLEVPLHMTMHMVPGPEIYVQPEAGARQTVSR